MTTVLLSILFCLEEVVYSSNQLKRLCWYDYAEPVKPKKPYAVQRSSTVVLPTEDELNEDVTRKLHLSDMFFFLNVPNVSVSLAANDAAVITERNEAYAEVCPQLISY